MTKQVEYQLFANIAVQRHFIKELLTLVFSQAPNPIGVLDNIDKRTIATLEQATLPISDPTLSDAMMQEMVDVAHRILAEIRQVLASLPSQHPPTDQTER
jgi:DNA-directed RNA polymerase specialized sigma54-like protein